MTGITTTPHLHFQIDKSTAAYHPYWPYSFSEASKLGLDFFTAVNVGLGKENAIAYTVHPLDFVQNNLKPITL
jgi:murein DD-endopeptidase MepM/ murein hydrolase activator NlpD